MCDCIWLGLVCETCKGQYDCKNYISMNTPKGDEITKDIERRTTALVTIVKEIYWKEDDE